MVDDGSADGTVRAARQFAAENVLVVEQTNQGAAAARNTAYSLSHGDYIQWLDADDLLASDKIARQMETRQQHGSKRTLYSGQWAYFFSRPEKAKFSPTPLWCDLSPVEWLSRKMSGNLYMALETWLVSRELAEAAGPWNTRLLRDNDGEYFCRVVLNSDGIRFTPGARCYYRRAGSGSVSYIGRSNEKLESLFLSMNLHMSYLRSLEDSAKTRDVCVKFLQDLVTILLPGAANLVSQLEQLAESLGGIWRNRNCPGNLLGFRNAWVGKKPNKYSRRCDDAGNRRKDSGTRRCIAWNVEKACKFSGLERVVAR